MRRVVVLAAALMLCGCAAGGGYDRAMQYTSVESVPFDVPGDDVYKVFDKPAESRMLISPSYAKTAALGVISGATLRTVDVLPRVPFESAANGYLASTGRTCRIVEGELVIRPHWEFKYDCNIQPVPVATAEPPKRRR